MQIKICGIVNIPDALYAINAGASAIGLVFCPGSKRRISVDVAQSIVASVPCFNNIIGLFQNQCNQEIQNILDKVSVNILQFHGDESFEFCESFKRPYIKSFIPKNNKIDSIIPFNQSKLMRGILVDAGSGSGKTFDWHQFIINNQQLINNPKPLILAGGLNHKNVAEAITIIKPAAVDVSTGVESEINPPHKDYNKIDKFIANALNIC